MQGAFQHNDMNLSAADIRALENADELARFFATLGYDVDERRKIPVTNELAYVPSSLQLEINSHEIIAHDPVDNDIKVYLFEVRSITANLRNGLARGFLQTNDQKVLLVLTKDYSELEFVIIKRGIAATRQRGVTVKSTARPIPLTVNRQNPEAVKLRVLKRFTFTEEDSDYQWEKLRSAYMLAEWGEEYFNNRALFSDYYLKERLTEPRLTPEWDDNVRPVAHEISSHMARAPQKYSGESQKVIREGFYEPIFTLLGFAFEAQQGDEAAKADYLLYSPGEQRQPLAAALTYQWNRNLDDVDTVRDKETPDEIPGAEVVSLLEGQVAPWVIVTNGKLWRLYSATASNRATNYYEVDLSEASAVANEIKALKYWWLLFRRQAFEGFLERLLKESADYARALGERLKDRVFVEIFPQFARGFIADMEAQGIKQAEIDLDRVFSGTMTFLYRLMFILYAESRELLPIHEHHGYAEQSLYTLKRDLAGVGGENENDAPATLKKHYKTSSNALYGRLKTLFGVIDSGSPDLNMPTYNGGLFSRENEAGRFLEQYAVPDQYLALGLDRLTRDEDDKTKKLVFIDFKSLGVRHLGSVYEGLLEFRLKIASESLAVTKEKGKEVYQPAKKVKKPLATIAKGEVYLENDKKERKATGSYYTPDYIVKYIVQHTVGPVLERKLNECAPRLREAQKAYRQARELALQKGEDPEKFWQLHEPASPMSQLVDDCLNIRVLDPAMGSGHFLVEAVDFISGKLINFLNAWSENPVWAALERTRADILNDMERQHVSIDADKLTRVTLLKRAVLKRCVYGVDLNPMAVELAKVSLWLDAFTLGAPLNFLDHHLKHGNSLIGARVKEAQAYLRGGDSGQQIDMFARSEWAGLMMATDLMRQVSYLTDNTVEQAESSKAQYQQALAHLQPYKRILDVYTSRWFGNAPAKKAKTDNVRLLLKQDDVEHWLKDPAYKLDDSLIPANAMAQTALKAAGEKRFFHWELEFPEVFFAPSQPGGQDVQLHEDGGFDAVVGNPPYVPTEQLAEDEKSFFVEHFSVERKYETSVIFSQASLRLASRQGLIGLITPIMWQTGENYTRYRREVLKSVFQPSKLINLPFNVFPDAYIDTGIQIIGYPSSNQMIQVLNYSKHEQISGISDQDERWTDIPWEYMSKEPAVKIYLDVNQFLLRQRLQDKSRYTTIGDLTVSAQGIVESFYKYKLEASQEYSLEYRALDAYRYEHTVTELKYINMTETDALYNYYINPRILIRRIVSRSNRLMATFESEPYVVKKDLNPFVLSDSAQIDIKYLLAFINSSLSSYLYTGSSTASLRDDFRQTTLAELNALPVRRIDFTTPADERERLTKAIISAVENGESPSQILHGVQEVVGANQTDVVHDVLAHLAQRMIDLNKQKQAEVKRFLGWLESTLKITPKNGAGGIASLTGKTILQGYLGDYQKGEAETRWQDFYYRLHQNRNRFGASLAAVEAEIQRQYEASLQTLLPIKRDLARTDALIDKIVYRLYGLTDAEIELIERPQYEQALAEAKAQVVADDKITDDEEKIEKIAEGILPAARRFFERVEPREIEVALDAELPNWRSLPADAPTFLLTGDYNLRTLPDHMDFSSSVIPYTKAVEVVLHQRVFEPFRAAHSAEDVANPVFKDFMLGKKVLTLGNYPFILPSGRETALRGFMTGVLKNSDGVMKAFRENARITTRNEAAHARLLSREEAQQVRAWAFGILGMV